MEDHFKLLLRDEFQEFKEAIVSEPSLSVRRNPVKSSGLDLFRNEESVPWNADAFYLKQRPKFWADPLHHAGAYYVQEASSMFFPNAIDFSKDLLVLDLCAAPGGKSSLLLSMMTEGSLLVSNELQLDRNRVLVENLTRWGYPNVVVTNNKASDFEKFKGLFDVVLVDAPCSGEGMFRKDKRTLEQWSTGFVNSCVNAQNEILKMAPDLVKEGGLLVYSTCTYEPLENELQAKSIAAKGCQPVSIPIEKEWGVLEKQFEVGGVSYPAYQFMFHRVKGEGQFVCALRKAVDESPVSLKAKGSFQKSNLIKGQITELIPEEYRWVKYKNGQYAIPAKWTNLIYMLASQLNLWKMGVALGEMKRDVFVPHHDLAMSSWLLTLEDKIELEYSQALEYLKRVPLSVTANPGFVLMCYKNVPLGWGKAVGGRVNNNLPKHLALRKTLT